ncbi:ABC transporter ATP-binding protein [Candidatus Parcubacteria bacterium]|nr:MAG: ABC transporter ATP-binding protein [Candidatus Parcubacteria bacterium]
MIPIISIKNLSVIYDKGTPAEVVALSDVTIDIFPGEFVIVFGPSGCGKSTLLYAISGAERRMTEGELWIKGKNLREMEGEDIIAFHRESVGMVFQAYNLIPTVNVFDNIILPLVFRGVPKDERLKKGKELIERFGIDHLAKMRPALLSGGQQQRVGIARALVNDTEIILADEPTGNLDSQSAFAAMDIFTDLNVAGKKTVILVTHESQYLPYASRIIYMKDGKITGEARQESKKISHIAAVHPEEGKQAHETISLNIERLLNYLELNLVPEEREIFERELKKFAARQISKEKLFEVLDAPFRDGGIGLYKPAAMRLAQELSNILELSAILHKSADKGIKRKSEYVFNWLFADYEGKLSQTQEEIIKKAIHERLKGASSLPDFQANLDKPVSEDGAGLNERTAKNIAQKMGLIF